MQPGNHEPVKAQPTTAKKAKLFGIKDQVGQYIEKSNARKQTDELCLPWMKMQWGRAGNPSETHSIRSRLHSDVKIVRGNNAVAIPFLGPSCEHPTVPC